MKTLQISIFPSNPLNQSLGGLRAELVAPKVHSETETQWWILIYKIKILNNICPNSATAVETPNSQFTENKFKLVDENFKLGLLSCSSQDKPGAVQSSVTFNCTKGNESLMAGIH